MWRSQLGSKEVKAITQADDDDWDTDPDFVNDVSEQEQRWGSKTIEGSAERTGAVSMTHIRERVKEEDTKIKSKSAHHSQSDSAKGYGGTYGVQKDRQDKSAMGWEYQANLAKHQSQTDAAKGFGGKFGVQQTKDKSAVGWDYQENLAKHASQTDGAKGFGGKYGVQENKDKNAEGWEYQADLSKHESQTDASKGFGGKYGVQKDRLDESAVGWDHQEKLAQHSSQSDSSKGFGGKYGVQKEQQDKSAVGFEYQANLSKHVSQTDGSKGFGGKYGVETENQDASAGGYDDMQDVRSDQRTDRGVSKGQAGNICAKFENMAATNPEPPPPTRKHVSIPREQPAVSELPHEDVQPEEPQISYEDDGYDDQPQETNCQPVGDYEEQPQETYDEKPNEEYDDQTGYDQPEDEQSSEVVYNDESNDIEPFQDKEQSGEDSAPSARAVYDYQAVGEDEISFDPDDVIMNIEQVDDGWWIGEINGSRGLFPANYVELI